jgi:dTDP-glucose 4,6-dehydratase
MDNPLQHDLEHILTHTQGLWDELRGRRIFITGGTGFFGCWLLESFAWANDRLGLNAEAVVLTRDPEAFIRKAPHLAQHRAIRCHVGDIRNFEFPSGRFSHVIHAATEASAKVNADSPLLMFDTIVQGTRRALDFAVQAGTKRFLLTSSGAVYGKQPPEMTHLPESYEGGPNPINPASAYGEGKRVAELLCTLYARHHGLEPTIARCFAFVGPYLPLDSHYAIGNFIRDALKGGPITINGDGTTYRSYLYAADLAIWLWSVLFRGLPGTTYNVGSGRDLTIGEIASIVAYCTQTGPVVIREKSTQQSLPERYVPDIARAKDQLDLTVWVDLEEAIRRTFRHQVQCRGGISEGCI